MALAVLGFMLLSALGQERASALENQQASKATASVGGIEIIDTHGSEHELFTQQIKTSNQKDLFIDVSLECGVYTRTKVESKGGNKNTSTAYGVVALTVTVDGKEALPGEVIFCSRYQELSAQFAGILQACEKPDLPSATVGDSADGTLGFTAGDKVLTVSDGSPFAAGDLIVIGNEWLFVESVDGNDLTVVRGSLGSLEGNHADGTPIYILDCPPPRWSS